MGSCFLFQGSSQPRDRTQVSRIVGGPCRVCSKICHHLHLNWFCFCSKYSKNIIKTRLFFFCSLVTEAYTWKWDANISLCPWKCFSQYNIGSNSLGNPHLLDKLRDCHKENISKHCLLYCSCGKWNPQAKTQRVDLETWGAVGSKALMMVSHDRVARGQAHPEWLQWVFHQAP